jgi:asparagine synthase (glutamine-hydrolysing)
MFDEVDSEMPEGWMRWTPLERAQLIEVQTFMSSYLLSCQGDRVAMAHGVEVRYPFLDPEVVDFCMRLPDRLKLRGLRDKRALRRFASTILPHDLWGRAKRPYRAPSIFEARGDPDYADELLSDHAIAQLDLADRRTASALVDKARRQGGQLKSEREVMALTGLLTLQILGYAYLKDFSPRAELALKDLRVKPRLVRADFRQAACALT